MLNGAMNTLSKYLPELALAGILRWFDENPVHMIITRNRSSKSGDWHPPKLSKPAQITINYSLNRFEFLITLVHEMAHHAVWLADQDRSKGFFLRRRPKYRPHGKEWKSYFLQMMKPYLNTGNFPPDILLYLEKIFENPRATTSADHDLKIILKKYDTPDGSEFVEDLPYDAVFRLPGGQLFRKKEKLRTRYRCIRLDSEKVYLFNPAAQVFRA